MTNQVSSSTVERTEYVPFGVYAINKGHYNFYVIMVPYIKSGELGYLPITEPQSKYPVHVSALAGANPIYVCHSEDTSSKKVDMFDEATQHIKAYKRIWNRMNASARYNKDLLNLGFDIIDRVEGRPKTA